MPYCGICGNTGIAHGHTKMIFPLTPELNAIWRQMRQGSNFEVPEFRQNADPTRFPLLVGKSKKLYRSALARAFYRAAVGIRKRRYEAIRFDWGVAVAADDRLFAMAYPDGL